MIAFLIILAVCLLFLCSVVVVWDMREEKEKFNNKICPDCGTKMYLVTTIGDRLYWCQECGYHCTVKYSHIDGIH